MLDEPGPWGSGPFTLVEGHSTVNTEQVAIAAPSFAATYLWREDRTPRVRLVANRGYWDQARGPRLESIIFRNDLTPAEALELVCTTEGEVDIVTEVAPADAARVQQSAHANLVAIDAVRSMFGIINRGSDGFPFGDVRARQALNLALDQDTLIAAAMHGHAKPIAALTPPSAIPVLEKVLHPLLKPYGHDPDRARALWQEAGAQSIRPLRLATIQKCETVAHQVAANLRFALQIEVEVTVYREREDELMARRQLAEHAPKVWDVLIWEQGAQEADGVALELHHAIMGERGEYRTGPTVPEFMTLFGELRAETSKLKQAETSYRMDRLAHDEAIALFLCAPEALYAVNKHVDFTPYRTTFELAECEVDEEHWSR